MKEQQSSPAWFCAGLVLLAFAYADVAMPAPFALLFNAIFATGACVVAARGFQFSRGAMRIAFGVEFFVSALPFVFLSRGLLAGLLR